MEGGGRRFESVRGLRAFRLRGCRFRSFCVPDDRVGRVRAASTSVHGGRSAAPCDSG